MKRKFLSVLTALAITVSLSACQPSSSTELIDSVTTVVEETVEPVEMKTIEPPEDGWTLEELLSVTYVYGQQLENPCTLNTLGDEFNFNISTFNYSDENNSSVIILQYNGNDISSVELKNCFNESDVSNSVEIAGIFLTDYYKTNIDNVVLNGISFFSSKEQVIECFGIPDFSETFPESSYITYNKFGTTDKLISFGFNENNETINFHITF